MSDIRNLIIGKGTESYLAVNKAKADLEDVKKQLDVAKARLAEANEEFEQVLSEVEAAGVTKSKAKKAIEEINQTLESIGIISVGGGAGASDTSEKTERRKRKEKSEKTDPVQTQVDNGNKETDTAAEPDVNVESESSAKNVEVKVSEENKTKEAEATDELVEIETLIDEATVSIDEPRRGEARDVLKNALAMASKVAIQEDATLDLDYFRSFLTELSRDPGLMKLHSAIYVEFVRVLSSVEEQAPLVQMVLPEENGCEDVFVEDDAASHDAGNLDESSFDEDIVDEYDDYSEDVDVVSDDDMFPVDDKGDVDTSEVTVVDDIAGMDFLSEPAADESPVEETKKERKPFAPPPFIKR